MEDKTFIDENEKKLPVCVRMNVYCDISGMKDSLFNNIQEALKGYDISKAEWDSMLDFIDNEWEGDFRVSVPVIVERDGKGGIEVSLDAGNWCGDKIDHV